MTTFQALSRSVSQREQSQYHAFQMENSPSNGAVNFDRFFENVEAIKNELRDLETLYKQLQTANEQSETLHNQESIKDLMSKMDNQVVSSLMELGFLGTRFQALHRSTTANDSHFLKWMGCMYILFIVIILVMTLFAIRPWG